VPSSDSFGRTSDFARSRRCFHFQFEDDFFADEVVGFAGIFDFEIEAVDEELGREIDGVVADLDIGWKGDLFGDAVQREIAGDEGVGRLLSDGDGFERGGRDLGGVEEVGALEVAGEAVGVGEQGIDLDDDFVAGVSKFAVGDFQFARELFESALVFARDFRADEVNGGIFGTDDVGAGARSVGGRSGCGRFGGVGRGDFRGRNIVSGIGATPEEGDGQKWEKSFESWIHNGLTIYDRLGNVQMSFRAGFNHG
jgi:hypothetical protein